MRKYYTGEIVYKPSDEILDTVTFSQETYDTLIEGMRLVVEGIDDFSKVDATVGGKTGTAQVSGKTDYALFSGFAPLTSPQIVVSCVIEEGKYGTNAARATVSVFEEYFEENT